MHEPEGFREFVEVRSASLLRSAWLLIADLRVTLVAALAALPPRQRATVVLRYFDDLTEADTALALGCSVGTVKTQCSRAMQTLRDMPGLAHVLDAEVS